MKILVTGASGFIGSALCAQLSAEGHAVRAAVRSRDRAPAGAEVRVTGEIDGSTDWGDALQGVAAVVHLAARAHVLRESAADPLAEFRRVNTGGTLNLARQAAGRGVRRFVYASSVGVNGERTTTKPFDEADAPRPAEPYAVSKWEAEQGLEAVAGLERVVVRPPLVYGPGCRGNFLRLLQLARSGVPLPLASVRNRRSLVFLGNLLDALSACVTHPAAAGQTFLVCDDKAASTPELLHLIARAMDRPVHLFPAPHALLRLGAGLAGRRSEMDKLTASLVVDASKIRERLGWRPRFTLEQGLAATARGYAARR